jgi:transcriptional regulator with GAF, ATPase, and Fis domain
VARLSNSMLGQSRAILDVVSEARYVAPTDSTVLITGESGVGKELLAHFIHENSPRSRRPLASINCAGVPETLLESELFGHTRGSFTDAHTDRAGLFESANGGTVLLDEVGEMGPRMQALLLRVLENGEIQRIGSDRPKHSVDVRMISATNRDLLAQTRERTFRLDLYYRLNVVNLIIPPLRQRRDDIRLLLDHYLSIMSTRFNIEPRELDDRTYALLEEYNWPGNIRELRNVVERLTLQQGRGIVMPKDLPAEIANAVSAGTAEPSMPTPEAGATPTPGGTGTDVVAAACFERMVRGLESFWTVVYEPFMMRDITRATVRDVVWRGLRVTKGSYKALAPLFNVGPNEYKRMLNFLQQHDCHLPFQPFRAVAVEEQRAAAGARSTTKAAM